MIFLVFRSEILIWIWPSVISRNSLGFPLIFLWFPLILVISLIIIDYHSFWVRSRSRSQIEDRRKSKLKIKIFGSDQNVVKIMIPKFHLGLRLLCQYTPQKSNLAIRFFWTPNSAYWHKKFPISWNHTKVQGQAVFVLWIRVNIIFKVLW